MKYLIYSFIAALVIVSCQIKDENAPSPNEAFTKYYGELTSYEASDIEIIYDQTGEVVEGFVVFGTTLVEEGNRDFFIMRTDVDGNLIHSVSYGWGADFGTRDWDGDDVEDDFVGDESAGQIEIINGGYVIIGTTTINETALGISDYKALSFAILNDEFEVVSDSVVAIFSERGNTDLDLIGNDVIYLSDNSLLLVGSKEIDRGAVKDFDNYFLKINSGGIVFEATQGVAGTNQNEEVVRVFEKANGNLVMIGYANTPSGLGENNGNNGTNAYFLEIDPNGTTPVNSGYYGVDDPTNNVIYNDIVTSAISTSSGFVIAGTSSTSDNNNYGFVLNVNKNGVYLNGSTLPSNAFNGIQTRVNGLTQADDNDIVLVGQYPNFSGTFNGQSVSKSGEGMFMKVDQSSVPVEGNEINFGLTDGNDNVVDAVTLPDGKIVAVANVDFGGGVRLIALIKSNDDGTLHN